MRTTTAQQQWNVHSSQRKSWKITHQGGRFETNCSVKHFNIGVQGHKSNVKVTDFMSQKAVTWALLSSYPSAKITKLDANIIQFCPWAKTIKRGMHQTGWSFQPVILSSKRSTYFWKQDTQKTSKLSDPSMFPTISERANTNHVDRTRVQIQGSGYKYSTSCVSVSSFQ